MRLATAARLVETRGVDATDAGLRFLSRAADHGIDLELLWAVTRDGQKVRQAALVVPQPGRTAMLFLSGVGRARECGDRRRQHEDRVALLRGVLAEVPAVLADRVHLVQALPAPEEWWATEAFAGAGMTRLGDLAYLRRPLALPVAGLLIGDWPEGVTVSPLRGLDDHLDGPALRRALERSYIDTLDCPGLCDLRDTRDVIESHRATGEFDPSLWWVVRAEGEPEGCVLLSPSREQDTVELVYMGLGPALRGRGLGRRLLAYAIGHAQRCRLGTVTCAVDCRNEPARALYARLGFSEFARRIAYVHPVRQAPTDG
ncbi:MAG: GNAT family N-acetyltransferase [Phycisphaeraceae bacterium]|nr:MAG: GNAT family N-acetyltransferase [Phycisphaeraceae bacterium]